MSAEELRRARLERLLALLEAARAELDAGWLQGGWWSMPVTDGASAPVSGLAAAAVRPDSASAVCLVGALVRAAAREGGTGGAEAGPEAGLAVDAVYDALWESRGQASGSPGLGRVSAPQVRLARVQTLTRWNDATGRTRADVLAVLDHAISRTILGLCEGSGSADAAGRASSVASRA